MFTGIVAGTGTLQSRQSLDGDLRMRFEVPAFLMEGCGSGDSISVAGVCLTMLEADERGFSVDLSVENQDLNTLGRRRPGDQFNWERVLGA